MERSLAWLLVLASSSFLVACKKSDDHGAEPGELGRGTFKYACGQGGADAQCNDDADLAIVDPSTNLPSVALSSTFNVGFLPNDDSDGTLRGTQSGDADFLAIDSSVGSAQYVAERTGYVAVIGLDDHPLDLVHVKIESIDHLEFANTNPSAGGTLKGQVTVPGLTISASASSAPTMLVRVVPMTADRRLLAGALACKWTTSDATIVAIDGGATQNIVKVDLLKNGTATLHVTLGALSGDVTLTVGA